MMNTCQLKTKKLVLRWVTWWPVGYWIERFNKLCDYVELDVIFLASKSSLLAQSNDRLRWKFNYDILSNRADSIGYHQVSFGGVRWPKPWRLLRGNFDVIVMPYSDPTCILAAEIGHIAGKSVVLFSPNTENDARKQSRIREYLKHRLLSSADGVFITGPSQYYYTARYVTNTDRIHEIGNPAPLLPNPTNTREETRKTIYTTVNNWGSNILLFVGRLSAEKGLQTLLEAIKIFKVTHDRCPTLVIVGDGPQLSVLKETALRNSIPVFFAGFKQGAQLSNYYAAADVFVLPSYSEPWGLVVNEAMQFGLPVILSSKVGSSAVLLGPSGHENGMSFEAGNSRDLYECIKFILDDRILLKKMGRNAKDNIRMHSIENWCQAILRSLDYLSEKPKCQRIFFRRSRRAHNK